VSRLYRVQVSPGLTYECLSDENLHLKQGDEVIIRCERYRDAGRVGCCLVDSVVDEEDLQEKRVSGSKKRHVEGQKLPKIIRRATAVDKSKSQENESRAKTMHRIAVDRIGLHGLAMRLVDSHYSFDRRLVVFQFTAEGRVDFRELLRDLSMEFHTRVELRQIGVRDEAAIQGGIGPCGRVFCCTSFLKEFSSINVKMAKIQGLSLNPNSISGACGRLKCCLRYEVDYYREHGADSRGGARGSEKKQPACDQCRGGAAGKNVDVSVGKGSRHRDSGRPREGAESESAKRKHDANSSDTERESGDADTGKNVSPPRPRPEQT